MRLSMPEIGVKRLRGSKGRVRQTKRGQSVSKGAIAGKENKKEGQTSGSSTRKVRKKDCVAEEKKMKNWATMLLRFCVFLLTPMCPFVFLCLSFLHPSVSGLTVGACVFPRCPQRFVSQFEESFFGAQVALKFRQKKGKTCCNSKGDLRWRGAAAFQPLKDCAPLSR